MCEFWWIVMESNHVVSEENGVTARRSRQCCSRSLKTGAGKESRTLDLNLGKVALYQLSYSRKNYCQIWSTGPDLNRSEVSLPDLQTGAFDRLATCAWTVERLEGVEPSTSWFVARCSSN